MSVWQEILDKQKKGKKQLAVLIDPDRFEPSETLLTGLGKADLVLIGSSALLNNTVDELCARLKTQIDSPLVLFPGSEHQLSSHADALLFLSLISGRNPEYLIGKQVLSAPLIKQSGIETIPTGYILVDGGNITAAQYVTQSIPVPHDKPDLAVATALAGEMLGMSCIYMDAGSGAKNPIRAQMIQEVRKATGNFLMIGGGLRTPESIMAAWEAGADMVVVGTVVEENPGILQDIYQQD